MARQISSCIILCMSTMYIFVLFFVCQQCIYLYYYCTVTWKCSVNNFFFLSFFQNRVINLFYQELFQYVLLKSSMMLTGFFLLFFAETAWWTLKNMRRKMNVMGRRFLLLKCFPELSSYYKLVSRQSYCSLLIIFHHF